MRRAHKPVQTKPESPHLPTRMDEREPCTLPPPKLRNHLGKEEERGNSTGTDKKCMKSKLFLTEKIKLPLAGNLN